MRHTIRVGAVLAAVSLCLSSSAADAVTINKCQAGESKCVSKHVGCLLGCYAKAEGIGVLDDRCVLRCKQKLRDAPLRCVGASLLRRAVEARDGARSVRESWRRGGRPIFQCEGSAGGSRSPASSVASATPIGLRRGHLRATLKTRRGLRPCPDARASRVSRVPHAEPWAPDTRHDVTGHVTPSERGRE
jgi:hypothetical protein